MNSKRLNYIIITLSAITIAIVIQVVGTMLIFPFVTSLLIAKSFKKLIFFSAIIAVLSVFWGIIFSFVLNFPSGVTIVIVNLIFF